MNQETIQYWNSKLEQYKETNDFTTVIEKLRNLKTETLDKFSADNDWFNEVLKSDDWIFVISTMVDHINDNRGKYEWTVDNEYTYLVYEVVWDLLYETDILDVNWDEYDFSYYEDFDD